MMPLHKTGLLVSVIIPHFNQPDELEQCLRSLEAQTLERSAFEVIVVDNASARTPEEVVRRHPGVRLLVEPKPGPGLARNCGAAEAGGDILCFIDADCRARSDWLLNIVNAFKDERTILGGDVQIWRDDQSTFTPLEAYESVFAYRFKLYIEKYGFSGTGNLAVRRSEFLEVGPFAGIAVAEDVEWGRRAKAANFAICYIPEMVVFHPARRTIRELFTKWDRHIRHDLNAARKRRGWLFAWFARAIGILFSPIIDCVRVFTSPRISGAGPRFSALKVLIAVRLYRAWKMVTMLVSQENAPWNRNETVSLKAIRR
jgi:GT2 family glycosyltransferase